MLQVLYDSDPFSSTPGCDVTYAFQTASRKPVYVLVEILS